MQKIIIIIVITAIIVTIAILRGRFDRRRSKRDNRRNGELGQIVKDEQSNITDKGQSSEQLGSNNIANGEQLKSNNEQQRSSNEVLRENNIDQGQSNKRIRDILKRAKNR